MAKLENLCKNADEVKRLFKEKYLDREEFLGTDKFTFEDALYDLQWIYNLAEYGEKDATYKELEPYFLADDLTHREIVGIETFEDRFEKLLLSVTDEDKKAEFKKRMMEIWTPSKKLGDYILLSSEIKEAFDDVWYKKPMSYEEAQKIADKSRDDFYKQYNVTWEDIDKYQKEKEWEISRCKDPKPETNFRVVDSFNFAKKSDVIITDPCYINKWMSCHTSRSTIYGDWSCSVFECEKGKFPENGTKPFGEFCADS